MIRVLKQTTGQELVIFKRMGQEGKDEQSLRKFRSGVIDPVENPDLSSNQHSIRSSIDQGKITKPRKKV